MSPEQTAIDAVRLMWDGGFRHVPLVKNGEIRGVVSRGDFKGIEHSRHEDERDLWEHSAEADRLSWSVIFKAIPLEAAASALLAFTQLNRFEFRRALLCRGLIHVNPPAVRRCDSRGDPDGVFRLVRELHWVVLFAGAMNAAAGVLGAHGVLG